MPAPDGNPSCEHCGRGWGAHAYSGDRCPSGTVFTYRDPGHRGDHRDSVCQVCNRRMGQHHGYACPVEQHRGRTFEPYVPTLVRRRNMPEVNARPPVNGTFQVTAIDQARGSITAERARYSIEQRYPDGSSEEERRWITSFPDMDEARARETWRTLTNGSSIISHIEFRWADGLRPEGLPLSAPPRPVNVVGDVVVGSVQSRIVEPKLLKVADMPHLHDFANAVNKLAGELYQRTGRKQPLKSLVLDRDMMVGMGIEDGTVVATATGSVTLKFDKPLERTPTWATQPPLFGVDRTEAPSWAGLRAGRRAGHNFAAQLREAQRILLEAPETPSAERIRGQRAEQVIIDDPDGPL